VRLTSVLWTRTSRGFKHWRRTWGYVCQPTDLGQKTSWDIPSTDFPLILLCVHKDCLLLLMFIFNKFLPFLSLLQIENINVALQFFIIEQTTLYKTWFVIIYFCFKDKSFVIHNQRYL
jgi:hypothetical protein